MSNLTLVGLTEINIDAKNTSKIVVVMDNVRCIRSEDGYTCIYFLDGEYITVTESMIEIFDNIRIGL